MGGNRPHRCREIRHLTGLWQSTGAGSWIQAGPEPNELSYIAGANPRWEVASPDGTVLAKHDCKPSEVAANECERVGAPPALPHSAIWKLGCGQLRARWAIRPWLAPGFADDSEPICQSLMAMVLEFARTDSSGGSAGCAAETQSAVSTFLAVGECLCDSCTIHTAYS